MTRASTRAWVVTCALVLLLTPGCGKSDGPERACGDADAGPVVSAELLAFLSRARSAHHIADAHEQARDLAAATRVLGELVSGAVPGGGSKPPPEAREVLADTRARLADLTSQLGRAAEALTHVERGLELATEPTYFRGHLFEVRGLVEERRAQQLEREGKRAEAAAATRAALEAFEQAMKIQAEVIEHAVPRHDAGP